MTTFTPEATERLPHRPPLPRYLTITWILLVLLAVFPLLSVVLDLVADVSVGIPGDHQGALTALAGISWTALRRGMPGVAHYITTLEVGYAVHELVFAVLFLVIVVVPFRRGQWWAWWACWAVLAADLTYLLTFGLHDTRVLIQSLVPSVALPVLLLLQVPRFRRSRTGDVPDRAPAAVGTTP